MPSMRAAIVVSSASFCGSRGAGMEVISLSSLSARWLSADIGVPSKALACSIHWLSWARARSLDLAAMRWLSSLMKVDDSHCAEVCSG